METRARVVSAQCQIPAVSRDDHPTAPRQLLLTALVGRRVCCKLALCLQQGCPDSWQRRHLAGRDCCLVTTQLRVGCQANEVKGGGDGCHGLLIC